MGRRLLFSFYFAMLGGVSLFTSPADAQAGRVWVEPRVGVFVPTKDLGRTDVLGNIGFGLFERADRSPILGLGLGVSLGAHWDVRASVDRSLNAEVLGEWRCVPFVACPAVLLPLEGTVARWTAAVDAVYRPVTGLFLDPVLLAGIGLRRSELDWNQPSADISLPAFSFNETDLVYRVGAGLERTIGRSRLFGEFTIATSRFGGGAFESIEGNLEADRQGSLDVGFMGGIRLALW